MAKATPETKAKGEFKKLVGEFQKLYPGAIRVTFNAGGTFGNTRLDVDGVAFGHAFTVELKRFDGQGKLTTRQKVDLDEYHAAGALAMVVDSHESLVKFAAFLHAAAKHPAPMYQRNLVTPRD